MTNHDLHQFSDEYIIDAFVDNQINIFSLSVEDVILIKMYNNIKKVLSIECEIRDIKIATLIYQAEQLYYLRIPLLNKLK